jgi:hypothetical protein
MGITSSVYIILLMKKMLIMPSQIRILTQCALACIKLTYVADFDLEEAVRKVC